MKDKDTVTLSLEQPVSNMANLNPERKGLTPMCEVPIVHSFQ